MAGGHGEGSCSASFPDWQPDLGGKHGSWCNSSNVTASVVPEQELVYSNSDYLTGVLLSVIADAIIAVSLNIQKLAHNRNVGPEGKPKEPYLKLPLWWMGILLNIGGEVGNMLAYGFAPAAVVAPVGSVGVIVNELIAVFFLKEDFRRWRRLMRQTALDKT